MARSKKTLGLNDKIDEKTIMYGIIEKAFKKHKSFVLAYQL